MIVVDDLESLSNSPTHVVAALGTFDGVHLGHQEILKRVLGRARQIRGTATVFTFTSHPWKMVDPERAPKLITPLELKLEIMRAWGIQLLVTAEFNQALAETPARDFVKGILVDKLRVKDLFVGFDFAFGRGREGNSELLREMGQDHRFRVEVLPPVVLDGRVVSSTLIRGLLEEGQVYQAARLLGRPYLIRGKVLRGSGRGRALGFPTANLEPPEDLLIPNGVYAGWAYWLGRVYPGMINVGCRPTFAEGQRVVEAHLFSLSEEHYGEELVLAFWRWLREERRFRSSEELAAQLVHDKAEVEEILADEGEPYKNWALQPWVPMINKDCYRTSFSRS